MSTLTIPKKVVPEYDKRRFAFMEQYILNRADAMRGAIDPRGIVAHAYEVWTELNIASPID